MVLFRGLAICFFLLAMIFYPKIVFTAAGGGLSIWWQSVVPSLFPFFITAELLLRTGMAKALGFWLDPLMRPLFRLPGTAALAVVMGFVSGSPTGAAITADLRKEGLCTKEEGDRLLAFTNNAGPLYILAAVAVGIFQSPSLGVWLYLSHYPINLLFGVLLRFLAKKPPAEQLACSRRGFLKQGILILKATKTPPFGQLLGQAVKSSVISISAIGGFMVFFAVLTALLQQLGLLAVLDRLAYGFCHIMHLSGSLASSFSKGFFEMTIGVAALPQSGAPLLEQMVAAGMIIAWNGLSIQAQVISMLEGTDLSPKLYLISRAFHSILAAIFLLWATPAIPTSTVALPLPSLPGIGTLWLIAMGSMLLLVFLGIYAKKN